MAGQAEKKRAKNAEETIKYYQYALAFFSDGQEEWERHFFFLDSKWSDPRYEYKLNLTLHQRHTEWEAVSPRQFRSTYYDAY